MYVFDEFPCPRSIEGILAAMESLLENVKNNEPFIEEGLRELVDRYKFYIKQGLSERDSTYNSVQETAKYVEAFEKGVKKWANEYNPPKKSKKSNFKKDIE
ncbi:hypothetical protein HOD29_02355 [archaeon]|nr:hypothetical protein [archaeon]